MSKAVDAIARTKALDTTKSFIVQAPAGSGKTSLLTKRILALLGQVNEPEECLAITFTRKAAAEMRERILQALQDAHQNKPIVAQYDENTRQLAQRVLQRDKIKNWNLLDDPNRLKLQTIDSLNVSLTKRMPILSGFGVQPEIVNDAAELYILAADALLNESIIDKQHLVSLKVILKHLDNDRELIKKLFIELLPLREQWLPYIIHAKDHTKAREILEFGLQSIVKDFLQQLVESVPKELFNTDCNELKTWPGCELNDLSAWLKIAELLTTKEGTVRKTVTHSQGFPSPSSVKDKLKKQELKERKQSMMNVLNLLQDHKTFCENLYSLKHLPTLKYTEQQWRFLNSLVKILPLLVAQLTIIFREKGKIDLTEVSMAARMALGNLDSPSDLALALDAKIMHILVDEFQDTSIAQFRLLEHLTSGWTPGDGKTLFLVGDPMQSIYKFRQAEVGLFIRAQKYGIGNIKLEPLFLKENFRTTKQIINWVNKACKDIFPNKNNICFGEVSYSDSISNINKPDGIVKFVCFNNASEAIEAKEIVKLIKGRKENNHKETIAILVRSRNNLPSIALELKKEKIPYQGVEIELLTSNQSIQDILSLTKALLHLNDRISWLAILRAPWCGLTLNDLHALVGNSDSITCVWEKLQKFEENDQLSQDGKTRLSFVVPILRYALLTKEKQTLSELVYQTWLKLMKPVNLIDEQILEDIEVFIEILRTNNHNTNIFEVGFIERQLKKTFSKPKHIMENAVQIMTIHKAKGLEFDTVILPGLGKKPVVKGTRLFRWEEHACANGSKHLIFAPIKEPWQEYDPIYKFLQYTEQKRDYYELARLLYVATTRAKKALFGFATAVNNLPPMGSMLNLIPKHVHYEDNIEVNKNASNENDTHSKYLYRLKSSLKITTQPNNTDQFSNDLKEHDFFDLKHNAMIAIGVVTHKILSYIPYIGIENFNSISKNVLRQQYNNLLLSEGVPTSQLEHGVNLVSKAINNTLQDDNGMWILNNNYKFSKTEWSLIGIIEGQPQQIIIDRVFLDQKNIYWIIDYKISYDHKDVDPSIEYKYIKQLELYEKILLGKFPKAIIKKALYFPLQSKFYAV